MFYSKLWINAYMTNIIDKDKYNRYKIKRYINLLCYVIIELLLAVQCFRGIENWTLL